MKYDTKYVRVRGEVLPYPNRNDGAYNPSQSSFLSEPLNLSNLHSNFNEMEISIRNDLKQEQEKMLDGKVKQIEQVISTQKQSYNNYKQEILDLDSEHKKNLEFLKNKCENEMKLTLNRKDELLDDLERTYTEAYEKYENTAQQHQDLKEELNKESASYRNGRTYLDETNAHLDYELANWEYKLIQARAEADNLARDNKVVGSEISTTMQKLIAAHHNDVYLQQKEFHYVKNSNYELVNEINHFRDKMELEIKLVKDALRINKNEQTLVQDQQMKLNKEKEEVQEAIEALKRNNDFIAQNLGKYEEIANQLRVDNDHLRTELIQKERSVPKTKFPKQTQCEFHTRVKANPSPDKDSESKAIVASKFQKAKLDNSAESDRYNSHLRNSFYKFTPNSVKKNLNY